jgi:hypothetical protein
MFPSKIVTKMLVSVIFPLIFAKALRNTKFHKASKSKRQYTNIDFLQQNIFLISKFLNHCVFAPVWYTLPVGYNGKFVSTLSLPTNLVHQLVGYPYWYLFY